MDYDFSGKVALVTGGGSGIGRAICLAFANAGAITIVCDQNRDAGKETLDMIRQGKGVAEFFKVDISREEEVAAMVSFTVANFGRLDMACNNAGIACGEKPVVDFTADEWERVMDVNVKGTWLCMKYEIPELLKQSRGSIVNTASTAGLLGAPFLAPYFASKHAVLGLTKSSALEYARSGLRINAVCPGTTRTPILEAAPTLVADLSRFIPMGRMAEPEEIASAVLWLSSPLASYVTGHSLVADGAFSIP